MPNDFSDNAPPVNPGFDPWDVPLHPFFYLQHPALLVHHPFALLSGGLWIWMLIHCVRNDPERNLWLWILFIGNVPAAFIYFLIRWLPQARFSEGSSLFARWKKSRQIPRLEAAARNIGNAHQFVELGDAYRETGKTEQAAECFQRALQKEPTSMPALWGAAQVEMQRRSFASSKAHLEQILAKDETYKFGDVSLAYCRALVVLNETDAAYARLEQHLKRWTHPEAYVMIAQVLIDRGQPAAARGHLEATLSDLRGGPAFFARQNRGWARKARRLLARLPRA
jgi:hypothetical protein